MDQDNKERKLYEEEEEEAETLLPLLSSVKKNSRFLEKLFSRNDLLTTAKKTVADLGNLFRITNKYDISRFSALNPIISVIMSLDKEISNNKDENNLTEGKNFVYRTFLQFAYALSAQEYKLPNIDQRKISIIHPEENFWSPNSATLQQQQQQQQHSDSLSKRRSMLIREDIRKSHKSIINIHTDVFAAKMADSLQADAVTIGKDIFFAKGKYKPNTPQGIALILHELTHIQQQEKNDKNLQKSGGGDDDLKSKPSSSPSLYSSLEKEALGIEKRFLRYSRIYDRWIEYQRPLSIMPNTTSSYSMMLMTTTTTTTTPKINNLFLPSLTSISNLHVGSSSNNNNDNTIYVTNIGDNTNENKDIINRSYNRRNDAIGDVIHNQNILNIPIGHYLASGTDQIKDNPINAIKTHNLIFKNAGAMPFLAERGRDVSELSSSAKTEQAPPSLNVQPIQSMSLDIDRIAERVYDIIKQKIKMQREQRGFR